MRICGCSCYHRWFSGLPFSLLFIHLPLRKSDECEKRRGYEI